MRAQRVDVWGRDFSLITAPPQFLVRGRRARLLGRQVMVVDHRGDERFHSVAQTAIPTPPLELPGNKAEHCPVAG